MTLQDEIVVRPEGAAMKVRGERASFADTRWGRWAIRVGFLAVLLVAWQIGAEGVSRALASTPTEVLASAGEQFFVAGTIWKPLGDSLLVLFLGLLLSFLIGTPIGLLMGRFPSVGFVLDPYVSFLYALPHVALVPFMITTLGFEIEFRLTYVVFSAIWPFIINAMAGVRSIDEALVDTGKSYSANERQIMTKIVLPATLPFLFAGVRQGLSAAWIGVIVAEILSTLVGLGGQIRLSALDYRSDAMFVAILLIMAIAVAFQALTDWAQRKLMPWQRRATY